MNSRGSMIIILLGLILTRIDLLSATLVPTITVAIAVLMAYHLGASTGIGDGRNAGLFGTAVATMGMLSNAVYILSSEYYI